MLKTNFYGTPFEMEKIPDAVEIKGLPEHRLNNISLENINLSADHALICSDVENITLKDFHVKAAVSKGIETVKVECLRVEGFNVN